MCQLSHTKRLPTLVVKASQHQRDPFTYCILSLIFFKHHSTRTLTGSDSLRFIVFVTSCVPENTSSYLLIPFRLNAGAAQWDERWHFFGRGPFPFLAKRLEGCGLWEPYFFPQDESKRKDRNRSHEKKQLLGHETAWVLTPSDGCSRSGPRTSQMNDSQLLVQVRQLRSQLADMQSKGGEKEHWTLELLANGTRQLDRWPLQYCLPVKYLSCAYTNLLNSFFQVHFLSQYLSFEWLSDSGFQGLMIYQFKL